MTSSNPPSFIVSGTSSGSGKTTVALGLMAAFSHLGYTVQPFKCGPDFIDPGLHRLITGTVSRNLDPWMCGSEFTQKTYHANCPGSDISIIEGVMGMFDGGISSSGSLSGLLGIPAILVLDVRSMAESAAAVVKGFETLDPEVAPAGVIFNRVGSRRHLQLVSDAVRSHCRAEILGHLPRSVDFAIPSRHLGLLTGDETPISREAIHLLARTVIDHIDLKRLLSLGGKTSRSMVDLPPPPRPAGPCRIAVARDKAFCFYYEDNFDLLRAAGGELVFFSPLHDQRLPDNVDGVYLGGGYPELYAKELSNNNSMLCALAEWIDNDRPVYAECGGFMYLTKGVTTAEGTHHPLVGAFPVTAHMQNTRASLGYREVSTLAPSCFGPAGTILRGHEFHYSKIDQMPKSINRLYQVNNGTTEGYAYKKVLGGYLHLHFGFSPQVAREFINYCRE